MENDVSRPPEPDQRKDLRSVLTWSPSEGSSIQHSALLHSSSPPAWQGTATSETSLLNPQQEPNQTVTAIDSQCSSTWSNILKSRWLMVACLVFGIAAAVGHDTLNNHLFGKEARNQIWWLRLGQSLALVSKANSAISVSLAYQQIAWTSVGHRSFSVHAVDSLFGAAHNAIELLNVEAWNVVRHEDWTCHNVRTLNFNHEAKKWTDGRKADGDEMMQVRVHTSRSHPEFLRGQAPQRDDVADEICGEGWDCSTVIHFTGPGYRCEQLANGTNSTLKKFNGRDAPFNMSRMIPEGWNTYNCVVDEGDYAERPIEHGRYFNQPLQTLQFPENLGALRTEPVIWLGYVTVDDVLVKHTENSSQKGWDTDFTPVISACEHWQSYNVTNREYLRKVINTTYVDDSADDGTLDKTGGTTGELRVSKRLEKLSTYYSVSLAGAKVTRVVAWRLVAS
ncbi:hypothetical protein ACKAV7_014937 [Fusarium commune]